MGIIHLEALEKIRHDDWAGAHNIIQQHSDNLSCLIHGYLHHLEGDLSNAAYWYNRGHEVIPASNLDDEFERLFSLARKA